MPTWLTQVVVCLFVCVPLGSDLFAQTLRNSPLPPDQAIGTIELLPGLKVELAAAEPQVIDPVSAAFDHLGRMWVVEMRDYPTGPVDGGKPSGKIKRLTDEDGDGYFETAVEFADELVFPTGLMPFRDGVIATLAGQVTYFADTDNDGVCDHREVWFTGFSEDNEQLRANHPAWTLENEVHVASGLRGGEVRSASPLWPESQQTLSLSTRDFRFSPFGGNYRSVAGNSQFGFYQDDSGRSFVCSNRNPSQILLGEVDQVAGNPLLPLTQWRADVMPAAEASQVFPRVQAWTTSNLHAGQFTAACGTYRYQSDRLAPWLANDFFACEPTGSLVQRYRLAADAIVPVAERGRPGVEFLASTDPWFRPVDLLDGPDGSMYVVDMHRAVIEHPAWMPKELQNREDQRWGDAAGRIYRIVPAESSVVNQRFDFATTQANEWVAALSSDNRWARVTASRKLSETLVPMAGVIAAGSEKKADFARLVARLDDVVANETPGRAVSRALWLLRSIGELKAENLAIAVTHPDPAVRTQAVRLIAANRQTSQASATSPWPATAEWLGKLAADPSPIVRYQWLLEIAPIADESLIESILVAATSGEADSATDRVWISRAVSLVQEPIAPQLVAGLLATKAGDPERNRQTLLPLVNRLGWSGSGQTLAVLLENQSESAASLLFDEFASGLATRGTPWSKLTGDFSPTIVQRLNNRLAQDCEIVSDGKQPIAARVASLRRVGLDRSPDTLTLCQSIVDSDGGDLYVEALGLLRHFDAEDSATRLVARIVELPPKAATATVAAMVGNAKWTPSLIDALQTKSIPWGLIDPTSLGRLERHSDKSIADRVRTLRSELRPEGKQSLVARYSESIGQSADVVAGKAHFVRHCAACHKIDNQGVAVGPDISDMRTQTPEQILLSILDPSAAIDANYYRYAVLTTDGQLIEGLLEDSNETSVTLKLQEGMRRTIPRDEVEQLRATGVSMMPEGFENQLDPAAMRDLVAYVKRWRLLENAIPLGSLTPSNR